MLLFVLILSLIFPNVILGKVSSLSASSAPPTTAAARLSAASTARLSAASVAQWSAQTIPQRSTQLVTPPVREPDLSVVLLADTSGSMRDNDPTNLRNIALSAFIDMLGAEDSLSLITFSTTAQQVWPLTRLGDTREPLKEQLTAAMEPGGFSDYVSGLRLARETLAARTEGTKPIIVMLTDGEPYPSNEYANDEAIRSAYQAQLDGEIAALAEAAIPVYSVGFSEEVDLAVLENMAQQTQGQVSVQSSPASLEVALFNDIRIIKNRTLVLEETRNLVAGDEPQIVRVEMDELTRQLKLLLTHTGVQDYRIQIEPPAGVDMAANATLTEHQDYSLLVIEPAAGAGLGTWQVRLSGVGEVRLYADKDLHTKPAILAPLTQNLQSADGDLEVLVELRNEMGRVTVDSQHFQVRASITSDTSEGETPIELPLTFADGIYHGVVPGPHPPGNYQVTAELVSDTQLIASTTMSFTVSNLPSLTVDLTTDNALYRLGNKDTVTAQLLMDGVPLVPGEDLVLSQIALQLTPVDAAAGSGGQADSDSSGQPGDSGGQPGDLSAPISGSPSLFVFTNDGTGVDAEAADKFWSTAVTWGEEGTFRVTSLLEGTYRGQQFSDTQDLGLIQVSGAGAIRLEAQPATWLTGRDNVLPVTLINNSAFQQDVTLSLSAIDGNVPVEINGGTFFLQPEQVLTTQLQFTTLPENTPASSLLTLHITPTDEQVEVSTQDLQIPLTVTSSGALAKADLLTWLNRWAPLILLIASILLIFVLGGVILYRLRVRSLYQLHGELHLHWSAKALYSGRPLLLLRTKTGKPVNDLSTVATVVDAVGAAAVGTVGVGVATNGAAASGAAASGAAASGVAASGVAASGSVDRVDSSSAEATRSGKDRGKDRRKDRGKRSRFFAGSNDGSVDEGKATSGKTGGGGDAGGRNYAVSNADEGRDVLSGRFGGSFGGSFGEGFGERGSKSRDVLAGRNGVNIGSNAVDVAATDNAGVDGAASAGAAVDGVPPSESLSKSDGRNDLPEDPINAVKGTGAQTDEGAGGVAGGNAGTVTGALTGGNSIRHSGGNEEHVESVVINLDKLRTNGISISLGKIKTKTKTDYTIPDSSSDFILYIELVEIPIRNPVLAGWGSLRKREGALADVIVKADSPGFLEYNGRIKGQQIVQPGDKWQAGDVLFAYHERDGAAAQAAGGKNVLEGKL